MDSDWKTAAINQLAPVINALGKLKRSLKRKPDPNAGIDELRQNVGGIIDVLGQVVVAIQHGVSSYEMVVADKERALEDKKRTYDAMMDLMRDISVRLVDQHKRIVKLEKKSKKK